MSGYDMYYLSQMIYGLFTDKSFLKLKFFPKQLDVVLKYYEKIYNYLEIIMLKNMKKLINGKLNFRMINSNEMLLYKFHSNYLLKNYNKNDFMDDKDVIINVKSLNIYNTKINGYFQFLSNEDVKKIIKEEKIYITTIYNLENEFKFNNCKELLNHYIK
jgi:hypothetical protein